MSASEVICLEKDRKLINIKHNRDFRLTCQYLFQQHQQKSKTILKETKWKGCKFMTQIWSFEKFFKHVDFLIIVMLMISTKMSLSSETWFDICWDLPYEPLMVSFYKSSIKGTFLKRNVYVLSIQYDIIFKPITSKSIIILLKSSLSITESS